jgi:AcrR family transcriptional regulator
MIVPTPPPSMRERTRRAVHAEITAAAMALFAERGFDATTIDQIAEAAGISRRSFFHYFGNKEDVVIGDMVALGEQLRTVLESLPRSLSAWDALRATLATLQGPDYSPHSELTVAQLYFDAPSLRARHLEKHLRWQELFSPDIERRLGQRSDGGEGPDPRARAVIAASLAALDTAIDAWRESGGTADAAALYDEAVAAIRS